MEDDVQQDEPGQRPASPEKDDGRHDDAEGVAAQTEDSLVRDELPSFNADVEALALLAWVQAVDRSRGVDGILSRAVDSVDDICDGTAFFEVLSTVDEMYFRNPHGGDAKDNWILKTATLKRLYKLVTQYYVEMLQQSPVALAAPDLDLLAREGSREELCKLGRMIIGIAVRSDHAGEHIEAIQTLSLHDQQQLMHAIEQVMTALTPLHASGDAAEASIAEDENVNGGVDATRGEGADGDSIAAAKAVVGRRADPLADLEKQYAGLLESHRLLQASFDDSHAEKEETARELARFRDEVEQSRNVQADVLMRQEIERLKAELRRSEDNLAEADSEMERLNASVAELTRKAADQQQKADENVKLKDQLEELKHASDKLQRTENVMEKYKKKLEEGTEVRRQLKNLEVRNAELVDRNAAIEDEYRRVAHFKPLMDSYKGQISELEAKASNLQRDLNAARYDQEQIDAKLRATEEARAKEKEELELYQERIQELELRGGSTKRRDVGANINGAESLVAANDELGSDEEPHESLEDAMSGTTMASLKIQVRKLTRELQVAQSNKADAGRLLVAENLLQDANKTKERYEREYLREYQKTLKLERRLEAIQQGTPADLGDGPEANIALRMLLNETTSELGTLKKTAKQLESEHEQVKNELTIARSDLLLVDKDKLEVIEEIRASVNVEKADLERALVLLREEMSDKEEQVRMQLSQINSLLLDKVDLQSDGINQRDSALQRELEMGDLRSKMTLDEGRAVHDVQITTLQEKLQKARLFIRQQDKMIKDAANQRAQATAAPEEILHRAKEMEHENKILRQEQLLMMSAWYDLNHRLMRQSGGSSAGGGPSGGSQSAGHGSRLQTKASVEVQGLRPKSWLLRQRHHLSTSITLARR